MKNIIKAQLFVLSALVLASCNVNIATSSNSSNSDATSVDSSSSGEVSATSEEGSDTSLTSNPSSSQDSSALPSDVAVITFNMTSSTLKYVAEGVSVADMDGSYVSSESGGAVRLGSSRNVGEIVITFAEQINIRSINFDAQAYNNDSSPSLSVAPSGSDAVTKAISSRDTYIYEFPVGGPSSTLTLSTTAIKKRVVIYSITLVLGEVTPIYPTSINVASSLTVSVGGSKSLGLTYSPTYATELHFSYASNDPSIATVDNDGNVSGVAEGSTVITTRALKEDGTYLSASTSVTVTELPTVEKVSIASTYDDYMENNVWALDSCPTVGNPKLLVIPIWFNDSSTFILESKKETVRSDIEKAYFGSTSETGWHSVKSYYEEESKGAITLSGTVSSWYSVNKSYTTYGSQSSGGSATESLVTTATNWYFSNNPSESRTDYDSNGDGYLDGVLLIYAAPDYYAMNSSNYPNLWAYCYWVQSESNRSTSNPGPNTYFWASYDFMYSSSKAYTQTGKSSYASGDTSHCNIDAHTFIHEMGHVFGLEDYYDYGSGYAPSAGFSMQDYNMGGHDPYSVMALGWANPYIPEESCTIEISAFQKSHDLILLTPEWNAFNSPFDEYLLLELYTPTGLNQLDSTYSYASYQSGPTGTGIRLWHIDARLLHVESKSSYDYVYSASNITTNPNYNSNYGVYHAMSNTYNDADYGSVLGSSYYKYNILELIRNSTSAQTPSSSYISNSDLFGNGSSFNTSTYSKQFANSGGKLNSSKTLGWSFSVTISGSGENAVATVNLVRA